MIYGSVCSGIEAATVAWEPLGWRPAFFAEIEPFPKRVLQTYYPNVENLGDLTTLHARDDLPEIDLLVGGTPCQDFSIAGNGAGLEGERGLLALYHLLLVERLRPRWVLWENVPGVLSSNGGRDFGTFLGALAQLGYGFCYRVLDAQYYGVPQRRRQVFVVGHSGGAWQRAAAVLLEPESLRGHPPKGRGAGKEVAGTLGARPSRRGDDPDRVTYVSSGRGWWDGSEQAATLRAQDSPNKADTLVVPFSFKASHYTRGKDGAPSTVVPPLSADADKGDQDNLICADLAPTLQANGKAAGSTPQQDAQNGALVVMRRGVRRLTPRECERLQGFPDDYTNIPDAKDGPRYKALGNSMAVPVMRWIGERIAYVDGL